MRTGTTILHGPLDVEHRVPSSILGERPPAPGLACRTRGPLLLPIDGTWGSLNVRPIACLPGRILSGGSNEIALVVLSAPHQFVGIHLPGLHERHLWQDLRSL